MTALEKALYILAVIIIYFVIPPLIVLLIIRKKKKNKKKALIEKQNALYEQHNKLIDSLNHGIASLQDIEFDSELTQDQSEESKKEILELFLNGFSPAQDYYVCGKLQAYESYLKDLDNKIGKINSLYSKKHSTCYELYRKFKTEADQLSEKICKSLDELSSKNESSNSSLLALLDMYQTVKPTIESSPFQNALKKCENEKVSEIKDLIEMNEEMLKLRELQRVQFEILNELRDVRESVDRTAWTYKFCEQLCNTLAEIKKDPNYARRAKELSKVERFDEKSVIYQVDEKGWTKIGRDGDEFAIWTSMGNIYAIRPLDDILYYTITEETKTSTYSTSPSKLGIAIDAAIWGTAAAVVKAMEKQQQIPVSSTTRIAVIYFKNSSNLSPITIKEWVSSFTIPIISKLKEIFPEKEKSVASFAQQTVAPTTANESGNQTAQPNNIEMLREYKKLLDDGIISQEEFDAQKAKLLG